MLRAVPHAVQSGPAQLVGPVAPQQMLRLAISLKSPHPQEEEDLVRQLHDPESSQFHQYLSAEQWNARFAPSVEDEQAVVDWAHSQGLTVTNRFPNRLLVDVEAPVSVIERAFEVSVNSYEKDGKSYFSIDRNPSIPSSLSNTVLFIFGLNNFDAMHHMSPTKSRLPEKSFPIYSAGPVYAVSGNLQRDGDPAKAAKLNPKIKKYDQNNPYSPPDLYSSYAYNYEPLHDLGHCCNPLGNPGSSPPEASIAVAIWGDYADSDIQMWISQYGLALNATRVLIDGAHQCSADNCDGEATADLEFSTAMANSFGSAGSTAAVYVYEGPNGNAMEDVLNRIMNDGHVRVVNMSWGGAERYFLDGEIDSFHQLFRSMVGRGITPVASSGDGGATADCETVSVSYPASDPYVVAAGGTNLNTSSWGGFVSEGAWQGSTASQSCYYNDGGTGGGCSTYFSAPYYQPSACQQKRSVPDISLNADFDNAPQWFAFQQSWYWVGGTSISSPEIAGFFAQENAYLLYIGSLVGNTCGSGHNASCAPLGWANTYIYKEAVSKPAPHYPFYDVTTGCNSNDITQQRGLHYYCAAPGYDQTTGWGSANMFQFAWSINYLLAGDNQGPAISISGPPVNHWYTFDQTINWTMTDQSAGGHLANGVAGSSQAWDGDPGDPSSLPTPGTGNSYYGLQTYGSSGSASGLANLTQGCHTGYVRGWDNAGNSSLSSYGPLCFDNISPLTQINLSGNFQGNGYQGPVQVTLNATDNASGVAATYYSVDYASFQPYTGPINVYVPAMHCVQAYSVDVAGNQEGNEINCFTITQNDRFTLTVSKSGSGSGTVSSSDGGINCGSTCSSQYWNGQPVTLTAAPTGQSLLTGWRNCDQSFGFSCTLTITAARTVTAVFNTPVALQFVPLTPCRVVDTRGTNGPFGGPAINGGTSRDFAIPQGPCSGIPSNAAAYSLNVTVAPQGRLGYLTAWPAGYTRPTTSLMNSGDGRTKADATIVPAGDSSSVSVFVTNTANVIIDIDGYFVPPAGNTLAFFPLTPCRVVDTRGTNGPLGGPILQNNQVREFPILQATACNIPSSAVAYSFNVTALPQNGQHLGYLTAWPAGKPQPVVSTLNSPTGVNTANGAIIPAGTDGKISVYPFGNNTDLLIDINGYFATPAAGSLSLYTFNPCRVLDTRSSGGAFSGQKSINVAGSPCQVSLNAKAYSMNATVVPSGPLGYLTLWPDGLSQPVVSTLNAPDGAVTSNMAIVPTTNGKIDAFASQSTQLILDISSSFAP